MNTALGLVQDNGAAEDITQEVFISIFKNILSFKENSTLSTWIYRITVNRSLDYLRSKKRQKRSGGFIFWLGSGTDEKGNDVPEFTHPGVLAENREKSKYLFKALDLLPENQKTVFILTYLEDLPQKDVAEIMETTVKAVESLLQRAKANLRKTLGSMDI